jgi:hypothetical protein
MNRQAVPSILLSVAIVCFFAIVLYERDPHPRQAQNGGSPDQATPSTGRSPTPTAATVDAPAPTAVARSDAKPRVGAGPDAPIVTTRAVAPAIADKANERRPPAGGEGRAGLRVPAIQVKSNRPARTGAVRPAAEIRREPAGRPARAWLTAAGAGETDDLPRSDAPTAVGARPTTTWRER